ncbi:MAG: hypothetical protein IIA48_08680, partial [Bacteroidetes bacterium]|nr:hypothetical protein [Bacteroidota bacterium]
TINVIRPVIDERRAYVDKITSGTSGSNLTEFVHTFHSGNEAVLRIKQIQVKFPTVATANNGSNSATTTKRYVDTGGATAFVEAPDGTISYTLNSNGQVTKRIADVKTNGNFLAIHDPNTIWGITETGDGLDVDAALTYDNQGRSDLVTLSDGRVVKTYYSKLADGRLATLRYADYEDLATDKYHGPVSYSVTNLAGKVEVQATVELSGNVSTESLTNHVDETDDDPITAIETTSNKLGDLARMNVSVYDETGTSLEESRPFFLIPASGSGTEGTNYDATYFGYDDQGRRYRTKSPTGTINRVEYDTLGRQTITRIGDNDRSSDGGSSSGTDNMVKISESVYDSGSAGGNSLLTLRTAYVEDSDTDKRETRITHDVRGSVLLTVNPTTPHIFNKYDNMRRLIASGQFSYIFVFRLPNVFLRVK